MQLLYSTELRRPAMLVCAKNLNRARLLHELDQIKLFVILPRRIFYNIINVSETFIILRLQFLPFQFFIFYNITCFFECLLHIKNLLPKSINLLAFCFIPGFHLFNNRCYMVQSFFQGFILLRHCIEDFHNFFSDCFYGLELFFED